MTAILLDDEGNPYLDELNNVVELDNDTAFKQIIEGLFHCQRGSELWARKYGFDLESAIRESNFPNAEMKIESLVTEALDETVEKLIKEVNSIVAERDEDNLRYMNVYITVTSILGNIIGFTTSIGT